MRHEKSAPAIAGADLLSSWVFPLQGLHDVAGITSDDQLLVGGDDRGLDLAVGGGDEGVLPDADGEMAKCQTGSYPNQMFCLSRYGKHSWLFVQKSQAACVLMPR